MVQNAVCTDKSVTLGAISRFYIDLRRHESHISIDFPPINIFFRVPSLHLLQTGINSTTVGIATEFTHLKSNSLHEQYGPIIRIAPNELHFSDPDAYKTIYTHHGLRKESEFYKFMTEDSLVGQLGINDNKRKRKIFAGFFSTNAIRSHGNTDGISWTKANKISSTLRRLCQAGQKQTIFNITDVSKYFTSDVIKELVLGPSDALSSSSSEFNHPFVVSNASVTRTLWFVPTISLHIKAFPWFTRYRFVLAISKSTGIETRKSGMLAPVGRQCSRSFANERY